jgi:YD repeat-containing protein
MKIFSKRGLLIFLLMVRCSFLFGQSSPSTSPVVIPQAPNAAGLGIYGEIPVDFYNGLSQIQIPLYEIKSRDLQLPISLSYHASGIQVNQEASIVGLGWVLNAGGIITKLSRSSSLYCSSLKNPDIYFFNFANHSGKFVFESNQPQNGLVIKQDDLTIEPLTDGFKILDQHGFSYLFTAKEMTNTSQVFSWYLQTITSPNGNTIQFVYEAATYEDYVTLDLPLYQKSSNLHSTITWVQTNGLPGYPSWGTPPGCIIPMPSGESLGEQATEGVSVKTLYLKKIVFNGGNINFNYEDRNDLKYPNAYLPKRLKELQVNSNLNNNQRAIKYIKFLYDYSNYNNQNSFASLRLRLKGIEESGTDLTNKKKYTMVYNSVELPLKTSLSRDHWGYFNGPVNNTHLFQSLGANREPNTAYTPAGMIESITYPTGGKTTFEFESNDYSNKESTGFKQGGGIRIKKIINYDGVQTYTKKFDYMKSSGSGMVSSGKRIYDLNYSVNRGVTGVTNQCTGTHPVYHPICDCIQQEPYTIIWEYGYSYTSNYAYPRQSMVLDVSSPVSYDLVTVYDINESNNHKNGKTEYSYVNDEAPPLDNSLYASFYLKNARSDNGELLNKTIFGYSSQNNSFFPIEKNEYTYEKVNHKDIVFYESPKVVAVSPGPPSNFCDGIYYRSSYFSSDWVRLISQKVTQYSQDLSGTPLTQTQDIFYKHTINPLNHLVSHTTTLLRSGLLLKEEYKYPEDFSSTPVYQALLDKHVYSPKIETNNYKNTTLITSMRVNYKDWGNSILMPEMTEEKTKNNSYALITNFRKYDLTGNVLEVATKNQLKETYIWGYNNSLPVAKITGADYNSTVAFINMDIIQAPSSDQQLRDEINKIRTGLHSSKAQVSTYTYSQLGNLSSITDINNNTQYFEYDGTGRLLIIRDKDNNIIKRFCYNYAGQSENCNLYANQAKSKTFYSECPIGFAGSMHTYTVPAGLYLASSAIAADQMAENDLLLNGQNYANSQTGNQCVAAQKLTYTSSAIGSYIATFTNVNTNEVRTFEVPSVDLITTQWVPNGTYNITIAPSNVSYVPVQLDFNGTIQSGISFTFSNYLVNAPMHFTLCVKYSGTFTAAANWSSPFSPFSTACNKVTFTLVLFHVEPIQPFQFYTIGEVSLSARPTTEITTLNLTENSRSWTLQIYPSGQMVIMLTSGTPPLSNFAFADISYMIN